MTTGADVQKRSGVVLAIVAGGVCAGMLWASQALADFVRRPAAARTSVSARAASSAHAGARRAFVETRRRRATTHPAAWTGIARPSLLTASLSQNTFSMTAPEYLSDPATATARSIAVGDVSGDGRDDLVFQSMRWALNPMDNALEIYAAYQREDGRLAAAVKIADLGNNLSSGLLVADLDRDGVGDVITHIAGNVVVLYSNADGTFTRSTTPAGDPFDMLATDVDRDGYLDVLVDSSDTTATVVHGHARGDSDRTSTLPLPSSAVRTTGDVTGDGLDDLILATIVGRPLEEFHVYRALASGGYAAPVVLSRPVGSNQTGSLAVGDFNADGRADLALDEVMDYNSVHLYFQDAQGNLATGPDVARRRGAGVLLATDLDRDGRTDLAIAHNGWGYIGYYLQASAGFAPEAIVEANQYLGRSNYFATGDLNHDGCGDLVISRWSESPVLVYGKGCQKPRVANCSYPGVPMESPGLEAGLAPALLPQPNGDAAADVGNASALRPAQAAKRSEVAKDPTLRRVPVDERG